MTALNKMTTIGRATQGTRLRVTAPMIAKTRQAQEEQTLQPGLLMEIISPLITMIHVVVDLDGVLRSYEIRCEWYHCLEVLEQNKE